MFRFRLISPDGEALGPFVSRQEDWVSGDRIERGQGDSLVVTAVVPAEDTADFDAYLVVKPAALPGL